MEVDRLCTCGSLIIMFKFCGIIGISEIEFFNLSRTERVKQNQKKEKKIKIIQNLLSL